MRLIIDVEMKFLFSKKAKSTDFSIATGPFGRFLKSGGVFLRGEMGGLF